MKGWLSFWFGLLLAAQAHSQFIGEGVWRTPVSGGVVQVDQAASAAVLCASGTSCNFANQTITGALSNSALVVVITQSTTTNLTGMTVTWDSGGTNQSMTQVCQSAGVNDGVWIFGLLNPTSGNKTLALSWTNTGQPFVDSISLKGVNQTNIATAFQHSVSNSGAATSATVTVTSQANDLVVNDWSSQGNFSGVYSGTEIYHSNAGVNWDAASSYDLGAGTVNASATTTNATFRACGIDVVHS